MWYRSQVSIQPIENFPHDIESRRNVPGVLKQYVPLVFGYGSDKLEQHFLRRIDRKHKIVSS